MYDGLKVDTLNFKYESTWKYPKDSILSKLLYFAKGEKVALTGFTDGERTRDLESVEFLRAEFIISSVEKANLERQGFTVDDKKITLNQEE
jgi:hypothetical protein